MVEFSLSCTAYVYAWDFCVTGKVTEMSVLLNRRGRKATTCIASVDETKNKNNGNER